MAKAVGSAHSGLGRSAAEILAAVAGAHRDQDLVVGEVGALDGQPDAVGEADRGRAEARQLAPLGDRAGRAEGRIGPGLRLLRPSPAATGAAWAVR